MAADDLPLPPMPPSGAPLLVRQLTGTSDVSEMTPTLAALASTFRAPPDSRGSEAPAQERSRPVACAADPDGASARGDEPRTGATLRAPGTPGPAPRRAVAAPYALRLGGITDPGVPGKQNQDDLFFDDLGGGSAVLGVFDGHGRELGQLAASTARASVRDQLLNRDVIAAIKRNPKAAFTEVFERAHLAIEETFTKYYQDAGWTVSRSPQGYLTRQRGLGTPVMCVHGGTTATVLVILEGRAVIVANVGDSTALLAGAGEALRLQEAATWDPTLVGESAGLAAGGGGGGGGGGGVGSGAGGAAVSDDSAASSSSSSSSSSSASRSRVVHDPTLASSFVELSADHSPESEEEFTRMRTYRPSPSSGGETPELLFVYDTLSPSKIGCPPIFLRDHRSGKLFRTERGAYYKNVRNEWATLVATPPYAQFQDALAFTRSLGDLHLQTYGVSHEPEVRWVSLVRRDASGAEVSATPHSFSILMCSDGVWDNWKFEDAAAFVMDKRRVEHPDAQVPTNELMSVNLDRARANFGTSADNMTAMIVYFHPTTL